MDKSNWCSIIVALLVAFLNTKIVLSSVHTDGDEFNVFYMGSDIYNGEVYARNTSSPTNYTIIFEYIAPSYANYVDYYKLDINAPSEAVVNIVNDAPNYGPKTIKLNMKITNATLLKVHLVLRGHAHATNSYFPFRIIKDQERRFKAKSFTLVYKHDSTQSESKNRQVVIGERQTGDKLLYFRRKRAIANDRVGVADTDFEYINHLEFITSVTFFVNSPSAVVFLNSSFIDTHQVNAVVYDLNLPEFSASMAVYGYDLPNLRDSYQKIVLSKTIEN